MNARTTDTARCLVVLSLAFGSLAAQETMRVPTPQADDRDVLPIHTSDADPVGGEYGIWAAGADYKVSFHNGMTFVPYLGKDYPTNQPFSWTTVDVTVGGRSLLDGASPPGLSTTAYRAEYDLGGVVEAYDVRAEGLEQTFVIDQRPAGNGDLVVSGRLLTALQSSEAPSSHRELTFRDRDGHSIVTYGAATAVDARGDRWPMQTTYSGEVLELRLDSRWLESAEFPLVVDPLIGAVSQLGGDEIGRIDTVHCNSGVQRVATVYDRYASASDRDVFGHRTDEDGTNRFAFFSDVTSTWSSQDPKIAYVAGGNHSLTAFVRVFATTRHAVRFHTHDRADLGFDSTVLALTSSPFEHDWRPDVGGAFSFSSDDEGLVVFQRDSGQATFANSAISTIRGVFVNVATDTVGSPFVIEASLTEDSERPSINQISEGSANNRWLVAYQQYTIGQIGGSQWSVDVRQVDSAGAVSAPLTMETVGRHYFTPKIEGRNGRYIVAMASSSTVQAPGKIATEVGHELRVQRVDWASIANLGSRPHPMVVLNSNNTARVVLGGVAENSSTDSHWLVVFGSSVTGNLFAYSLGYRGRLLESERLASGPTSALGATSYDTANGNYVVAFAEGPSNIWKLDRFELPNGGFSLLQGTGCSGATIGWRGSYLVGSESSGIQVTGAPASSVHFLLLGTSAIVQPLVGIPGIQSGCSLLVPNSGPGHVGVLDFKIGSAVRWRIPMPENLSTGSVYFQDFHTVNGGAELASTQRLQVEVVK